MNFLRSLVSHRVVIIVACLLLFVLGISSWITLTGDELTGLDRVLQANLVVLGILAVPIAHQAWWNRQVPTGRGYAWGMVTTSGYILVSYGLAKMKGMDTIWDHPFIGGNSREPGMDHWIWLQVAFVVSFVAATSILMFLSSSAQITAEPKLKIEPGPLSSTESALGPSTPVEPETDRVVEAPKTELPKPSSETTATSVAAVSPESVEAPKTEVPKPRETPKPYVEKREPVFYSTR